MTERITCYERDEAPCDDGMCLRTGCRLWNDRLAATQAGAEVGVRDLARSLDPNAFLVVNPKDPLTIKRQEMANGIASNLLAEYRITKRG